MDAVDQTLILANHREGLGETVARGDEGSTERDAGGNRGGNRRVVSRKKVKVGTGGRYL